MPGLSAGGETTPMEKPLNPSSTLVSTWCYIFSKMNLKDIQFYAKKKNDDLWGIFEYIKWKWEVIDIFSFEQLWFDIWSFDWYMSAHKVLQSWRFICDGVSFRDSTANDKVYIWKWCKIENSQIKNSIILDGCIVKNSEIRDSIIDKDCIIENVNLTHKIIREESFLVKYL